MNTSDPVISFCSTCMNRGTQLQKTLEQNLDTLEPQEGAAELCLVNFIKDEEGEVIHDWIMSIGRRPGFRYAITRNLKHWHAPRAKNTAHLMATGKFLINLDCDNYISKKTLKTLMYIPEQQLEHTVFSGFTGGLIKKKVKAKNLSLIEKATITLANTMAYRSGPKPEKKRSILRSQRRGPDLDYNGTYGHIGMPKGIFNYVGGYDERFPPMGGQDKDLLWRASNLRGMSFLHLPQPQEELPILNNKNESLKNTNIAQENWHALASETKDMALNAIIRKKLIVNSGQQIGVDVEIIF